MTYDSEIQNRVRNISREIEKVKSKNPGLNYIECAVEVCERYNIEYESLRKNLSKNIKEKMEIDAMELNLLKYKNTTLF